MAILFLQSPFATPRLQPEIISLLTFRYVADLFYCRFKQLTLRNLFSDTSKVMLYLYALLYFILTSYYVDPTTICT